MHAAAKDDDGAPAAGAVAAAASAEHAHVCILFLVSCKPLRFHCLLLGACAHKALHFGPFAFGSVRIAFL